MPHKLIAKNTFFQILTRVVSAGITLIITLLIAKTFGVTGYGDYTKITALVGLFYVVVDFGLNALFLQSADQDKHFSSLVVSRSVLACLLIIFLNLGLIVFSLVPTIERAYPTSVKVGVLLYSFTIFSQGLLVSSSALFQKKLRYDLALLATCVGSLSALILVVILLHYSSLLLVVVSLVAGSLITGFVALYAVKQQFKKSINFLYTKQLFYQSLPLGLMLIANLIYFRIDAVLLSFLSSTEQVGLYGLSYRFFDFLLALPLFLSNSLYPIMLELKNSRSGKQTSQYYYAYGISGIIITAVAFTAAPLISFIRPDFAGSVTSFRILVVSLPLFFFTSFFQWILIAKKQLRFLLWIYVIFGFVNIVANILFIPRYGYLAAAVLTDVCEAAIFVSLAIKVRYFSQEI